MQPLDNISDRQKIFFGNTENCCLWHFQNIDNQYGYNRKITPNSTGKELDAETGYSYFGARYLDHTLITAWLSVDPMADKYPSISPYNYCMWNPMALVDPNGNDGRVVVTKELDGKTSINISTTVYLKSDVMTKSELVKLTKNAQLEAKKLLKTKVFGDCEVSFDVQYKVYEGNDLMEGDNLLVVDPNNPDISGVKGAVETLAGVVVGGLAGNTGDINSDITRLPGCSKGKSIVHETLHFLGLLDRYSDNHSFKGFESDIMGYNAKNARRFHDSHYYSYINKYYDAKMEGRPYILLKERIDVMETEYLKRINSND